MKMTGIPIFGIPFFGHIPIFVLPYLFHYYYYYYYDSNGSYTLLHCIVFHSSSLHSPTNTPATIVRILFLFTLSILSLTHTSPFFITIAPILRTPIKPFVPPLRIISLSLLAVSVPIIPQRLQRFLRRVHRIVLHNIHFPSTQTSDRDSSTKRSSCLPI